MALERNAIGPGEFGPLFEKFSRISCAFIECYQFLCLFMLSFQRFIHALHNFEEALFRWHHNFEQKDLLRVLGVETRYSESNQRVPTFVPNIQTRLLHTDYSKVASVVAAYAFFEILVSRANMIPCLPPTPPIFMLPLSSKMADDLPVTKY